MRLVCISIASLVSLTGCFTSETPLIGYWRSETPLAEGQYAHWPVSSDGQEWDRSTWQGEIAIKRRRYVSPDNQFAHQNLRLYELHTDLYLSQIEGEIGTGFGILWIYGDGKVISYHQAECGALSDAILAEQGLELDPEGFCLVDDLDQLEAIMQIYLETLGSDIRIDGVYRQIN